MQLFEALWSDLDQNKKDWNFATGCWHELYRELYHKLPSEWSNSNKGLTMSPRLGRNAPCYCGSGKKYKHCHLGADEQQHLTAPSHHADLPLLPIAPDANPRDLDQQLRELAADAPPADRSKYEHMLADLRPLVAFDEQRKAVDAASNLLEQYRDAFSDLAADKEKYLRQANALFREETFASLRFTAAEVRKELEKARHLPGLGLSKNAAEKIRAAILALCTRRRRQDLAFGLFRHLPTYVAAGRYMDAWLIQSMAIDTLEVETESNPFLFQMFAFGYDAWADEQRRADLDFLREAGIDPAHFENLGPDEIDAWTKAHASDPAVRPKMDAFLKANPETAARSAAQWMEMEGECLEMLEQDDAGEFLLPDSELEPWLPKVLKTWGSAIQARGITVNERPSEEVVAEIVQAAVFPLLKEMAQSIFTPQRISKLVSQLKQFRNQQFAAGNRTAATRAFGAITFLEREKEPGCNPFLNGLCFQSLRKLISRLTAQTENSPPQNQPAAIDALS